ncbi:sigma factor-like helix-turn-helix DNA-binding protein [Streptomyces sp. NPDC006997]|uniref:sigma factor-like helix-turn-helix DNA-binding protein n=1 Tax=Streptomyces sp. NPDC006997 TaxID=3155356 RepID=UPI0033EF00BF
MGRGLSSKPASPLRRGDAYAHAKVERCSWFRETRPYVPLVLSWIPGVCLAYAVAVQHLAPHPRAVPILRDVLDRPAKDVAEILGNSVNSVNSALQRARTEMREHLPAERQDWTGGEPDPGTRELGAPLHRRQRGHRHPGAGLDVVGRRPVLDAAHAGPARRPRRGGEGLGRGGSSRA